MRKLKLFLKGFFAVLFAVVLIGGFTLSVATADSKTRSITFGDETPSLAVERYKGYTEIYFFSAVYKVQHDEILQKAESTKEFIKCLVPSTVRAFFSITQKIKGG